MKDKSAYASKFVAHDRLGSLFNAQFVSLNETECIYEYEVNEKHLNPNGILHGGALFSVMDSSQGMLMHYILDDTFKAAATGTATIKYLVPVKEGCIRIRTILKSQENRKFFVNSTATDANGTEVAVLDELWIGIRA